MLSGFIHLFLGWCEMSNEMVERVAKAIWESKKSIRGPTYSDMCECIDYAKAAIAAMREPTDKMVLAATQGDDDYIFDFDEGYKRIIDAALKDD